MKLLFSLLLSASTLCAFGHEGHQAFYRLYVENGTLTFKAKLEIPDLKKSTSEGNACAEGQDFNFCAGTWLIDHLSIQIDGKTHSLTLESSVTEDGHLLLTYSLGQLASDFKQIDIQNTAFIESFEHYENIVEIELNNEKQGYKLSETRTSISHKPSSKP